MPSAPTSAECVFWYIVGPEVTPTLWAMRVSVIARVVAAALLFWALDRHPYGYFQVLRLVVCGVAVYCAALAAQGRGSNWGWLFVACAAMFNPFVPVHLNRSVWAVIDVLAGLALLLSIWFFREQAHTASEADPRATHGRRGIGKQARRGSGCDGSI
jgi:hypothetical protein